MSLWLALLCVCLAVWILVDGSRYAPPVDLVVVVRVRNGADVLEGVLRTLAWAEIARVVVWSDGSTDETVAIGERWSRGRPGVGVARTADEVRHAAGASCLVLDLRDGGSAATSAVLGWVARSAAPRTRLWLTDPPDGTR